MRKQHLPPVEIAALAIAVAILVTIGVLGQDRAQGGAPAFETYSSLDAAAGGYRAWYELLGREGVRVDRFERRAAFLDGTIDTLVYAEPLPFGPPAASSEADARALETWVRDGGRLVYLGHDAAAARRGILKLPGTAKAHSARARALDSRIVGVAPVESSSPLRWKPRPGLAVLVRDRAGALVVRYAYGSGQVTAVIDEGIFVNAQIGRGDAPRLAFALARPARSRGLVAFDEAVHGSLAAERWWSIVPRPFLVAIVVALFVFLLALGGACVRLGPPLVPVELRAPTSAEYIDSVAALLERGKATGAAVHDAVRSTARAVARAVGSSDEASPAEVAARLNRSDLREAYLAMNAAAQAPVRDDPDMVRTIGLAQLLRKELRHGRRGN